jgi:uncharacterized membrane protein (DUF485 family)
VVEMPNLDDMSEAEQKGLLDRLMRRQAALSIRVACGFVVLLVLLPLLNLYAPKLAARSVGGFTLTWLLLGVLFYPLTWLLSGYFVRRSDRIEEELIQEETR